jgi:hypothetical protein
VHVHIFGDGEVKINLIGTNGVPELISADGFKRSDVGRAMKIVENHQEAFLARWREIHG